MGATPLLQTRRMAALSLPLERRESTLRMTSLSSPSASVGVTVED